MAGLRWHPMMGSLATPAAAPATSTQWAERTAAPNRCMLSKIGLGDDYYDERFWREHATENVGHMPHRPRAGGFTGGYMDATGKFRMFEASDLRSIEVRELRHARDAARQLERTNARHAALLKTIKETEQRLAGVQGPGRRRKSQHDADPADDERPKRKGARRRRVKSMAERRVVPETGLGMSPKRVPKPARPAPAVALETGLATPVALAANPAVVPPQVVRLTHGDVTAVRQLAHSLTEVVVADTQRNVEAWSRAMHQTRGECASVTARAVANSSTAAAVAAVAAARVATMQEALVADVRRVAGAATEAAVSAAVAGVEQRQEAQQQREPLQRQEAQQLQLRPTTAEAAALFAQAIAEQFSPKLRVEVAHGQSPTKRGMPKRHGDLFSPTLGRRRRGRGLSRGPLSPARTRSPARGSPLRSP